MIESLTSNTNPFQENNLKIKPVLNIFTIPVPVRLKKRSCSMNCSFIWSIVTGASFYTYSLKTQVYSIILYVIQSILSQYNLSCLSLFPSVYLLISQFLIKEPWPVNFFIIVYLSACPFHSFLICQQLHSDAQFVLVLKYGPGF